MPKGWTRHRAMEFRAFLDQIERCVAPDFDAYLVLGNATKVGEFCAELGVTRQTLYRHVDAKGQLRPDGEKLLDRKGRSVRTIAGHIRGTSLVEEPC